MKELCDARILIVDDVRTNVDILRSAGSGFDDMQAIIHSPTTSQILGLRRLS